MFYHFPDIIGYSDVEPLWSLCTTELWFSKFTKPRSFSELFKGKKGLLLVIGNTRIK